MLIASITAGSLFDYLFCCIAGAHMERRLFDILVCPQCKAQLRYQPEDQELICDADQLAFPVRDGIPVMLINEARSLDTQTDNA